MITTVLSVKGGQGKTTTAIHLAGYMQQDAPTLLVDGDPNRSASVWARQGKLPFKVVDERAAIKYARNFTHIVVDTQARPTEEEMKTLAESCDFIILPVTPDALSLDALFLTIRMLHNINATHYKVLLTIVPPKPQRDGEDARAMLEEAEVPLFPNGIKRLSAFTKAALQGVLVNEIKDERAVEAWEDFKLIAEEVLSYGRE